MAKEKVLFVCIHNSARSQMAEELLRLLAGNRFEVESAGLEPGILNPFAVEVLREKGIDIAGKKTQKAADLAARGKMYDYVITVCDGANAERCPVFPGKAKRLQWAFRDPSSLGGSPEEKLAKTRAVRDDIEQTLRSWLSSK